MPEWETLGTDEGHDLGVSVFRGVLTMRPITFDLSVFRGIINDEE